MNAMSFLIVDDHDLILSGLKNLISDYYPKSTIETLKSAEEAIIKLSQLQWNFIITDVSLPGKSGIDLVQIVRKKKPASKVIVVTQHTELWIIKKLIEAAPDAIVLKSNEQEEIIKAILSVSNGSNYYSDIVYKLMIEILQKKKTTESIPELTKRELDILRFIAEGLTSKQISDKLFISEKTVEAHRKNMFVKFDVKNSANLIHKAAKAELL